MKTLTSFIIESKTEFRPVNWSKTRFSWISDMIKSYIETNDDENVNVCLKQMQQFCKDLSKGWVLTSRHTPNQLKDFDLKTIYDLCEIESKKDGLTKPKQAKLKKTMADIEAMFKWGNKNIEDIESLITSPDKMDLIATHRFLSKRANYSN